MKRSTSRRLLWLLLGAAALGVAVFVFAASQFLAGACTNDQVEEFPSPDGSMKAVVYRRDCGATTDYSRQIAILPRNRPLPSSPKPIFATDGDMVLIVRWESPSHLDIAYASFDPQYDARPVRTLDSAGSVKITYRPL
jgi:hypothetical protein